MKRYLYYCVLFSSLFLFDRTVFAQTYTVNGLGLEGQDPQVTLSDGTVVRSLPGIYGGKTHQHDTDVLITPGFAYPISYFPQVFAPELSASKGFFATHVNLNWEILASSSLITQFRIFRKPLGSTQDSVQIGFLPLAIQEVTKTNS